MATQVQVRPFDTPKAWTRRKREKWKLVFLDALASTGVIVEACKAAGISRSTAYYQCGVDPEFKKAFEQALDMAADRMEAEAVRRAVEGVEEPVFQRNQVVGVVRKYSDTLLMFLLRGRRRDVYGDKVEHAHKGSVNLIWDMPTPEARPTSGSPNC